jgi:hypothetical protein
VETGIAGSFMSVRNAMKERHFTIVPPVMMNMEQLNLLTCRSLTRSLSLEMFPSRGL